MGSHRRQSRPARADQTRHECDRNLSRDIQDAIFAHLTRLVSDPDHPDQRITYDEWEQRLRARAYRRSAQHRQDG